MPPGRPRAAMPTIPYVSLAAWPTIEATTRGETSILPREAVRDSASDARTLPFTYLRKPGWGPVVSSATGHRFLSGGRPAPPPWLRPILVRQSGRVSDARPDPRETRCPNAAISAEKVR